jgi:hypothetical protein
MADFVKGLFGAQKPVVKPADDGGMRPRAMRSPPHHHATHH